MTNARRAARRDQLALQQMPSEHSLMPLNNNYLSILPLHSLTLPVSAAPLCAFVRRSRPQIFLAKLTLPKGTHSKNLCLRALWLRARLGYPETWCSHSSRTLPRTMGPSTSAASKL